MLETNLCGIKLRNPIILASGILGVTKDTISRIGKNGAGAATLKSLCHEERAGNKNPTSKYFGPGIWIKRKVFLFLFGQGFFEPSTLGSQVFKPTGLCKQRISNSI